MRIREKWNKLTRGWFGTIIYIFVGYIIAYSIIVGLGFVLNTSTPVVSVFSCSMEHDVSFVCPLSPRPSPSDVICNQQVDGYDGSIDSYWNLCGEWYEDSGITKEQFKNFRFSDGLSVGDMLVVYNDDTVSEGDIVVFNKAGIAYPIIHRVVEVTDKDVVTKGDRNAVPDPSTSKDLVSGKAIIKLPLLGWVKLIFTQITGIA